MNQPNVLLMCADHWPGRLLGALNHPVVLTPTLDQLARNGALYTNAYSASPVCTAARRGLMTGLTPRTHGDRDYDEQLPMPNAPTLAQCFRDAGYQAYAVGKLHVFPQRSRLGFDDVLLNEEGRRTGIEADDYEVFLADHGYIGREFTHGISNNTYDTRAWHLPEEMHHTNWTVREMCRQIKRRDPTKPGFWYMSFQAPHPPLVPPQAYLDLYRDAEIPAPFVGEWARANLPYALQVRRDRYAPLTRAQMKLARQAFYALCTHIDHQIRLVIGLLREEGLLDHTIIAFTSDHGDMLGNHDLFAKQIFYEDATKIPLIIIPTSDYARLGHHCVDDRLVELCDVMPTLLDLAGVPIPSTVEGISLASQTRRATLYGEMGHGNLAKRMIRDTRYKLLYYATGNRIQLFDLQNDPDEMHDLAAHASHASIRERLTQSLMGELYGEDLNWVKDGVLTGLPDKAYVPEPDRGLNNQRGWRFAGSTTRAITRH
jgi:arylsulfatase A-like enzyme